MSIFKEKRKKKIWIPIAIIGSILAIAILGCAVYLSDYYRADRNAIDAYEPANQVLKQVLKDDNIVYMPRDLETDIEAGFIFYPGGKVEYISYEPLMEALASQGILCVLVKMPFNLAVFDINAADGIQEKFPEVQNWYIGGHSLGGSMAASYLDKNAKEYEGLILLGAYSTADLSDDALKALSIYGSEDEVLNYKKYESNLKNLPQAYEEVVIEGGCHAYFGMYGAQEGDGTPTVSNVFQIEYTAEAIAQFIN